MRHVSERVLDDAMARYVRGDDAAFAVVHRHAVPRVLSSLLRMCGTRATAEDLAQETFLRVSRARGSFVPGAAALPWILVIARNTFFDSTRRATVRDQALEQALPHMDRVASRDTHGDEALAGREMLEVVRDAFARLTARQREAFVLTRFEGLSVLQAAEMLGTTEAAVKLRAHRAHDALRAAVDAYSSSPPERRATGSPV